MFLVRFSRKSAGAQGSTLASLRGLQPLGGLGGEGRAKSGVEGLRSSCFWPFVRRSCVSLLKLILLS